ncbi:MAG: fibronectin type III domain-containing protein [Gemmatimonadetes bacterium]|nr:fibronectin type III domain-containing protein [Gemmatimonadota bacterium]
MSKRYPRTESEIAALALRVAEGLATAGDDFPNPPVSATELKAKLDVFNAADTAAVASKNAYLEQHAMKDDALEDLEDAVKADLRYAEIAVRDEPEKLNALGWRPRRNGSPLEPPGETRDISIVSEGDTWAILGWKPPVDGGAPGFYRIQRKREGSPWEDAGTSTEAEQLMSNQPRGIELLYRVIAVNKAGAGQPSATVTVVL